MNDWTATFMKKHNLTLSEKKTYITGRHQDGSPLTDTIKWPLTNKSINLRPPEGDHKKGAIKYLGIKLNLDCNWTDQINSMNSTIMGIVSAIRHGRITTLQTGLLLKEALSAKLEIGLRHAEIPEQTTKNWDKWIAGAILKQTNLQTSQISSESITFITGCLPLTLQHTLDKTIQFLESITKHSELQEAYKQEANKILDQEKLDRPNYHYMTPHLNILEDIGITIKRNGNQNTQKNKVYKGYGSETNITHKGKTIPVRNTTRLWGSNYICPP